MKKVFAFVLILVLCLGLTACGGKLRENKDYTFTKSTFSVDKGVTFENLYAFIPIGHSEINSISKLENYILKNIDEYYIMKQTANGREKIFLKNTITSINFGENKCVIKENDKVFEYNYTQNQNVYSLEKDGVNYKYAISYKNDTLFYHIEITNGFSVVHNFKVK